MTDYNKAAVFNFESKQFKKVNNKKKLTGLNKGGISKYFTASKAKEMSVNINLITFYISKLILEILEII